MYDQNVPSLVFATKKLLEQLSLPGNINGIALNNFDVYLEEKAELFCRNENLTFDAIVKCFLDKHIPCYPSLSRHKFIVLMCHLLICLKDKLEIQNPGNDKETLMSISEQQEVKKCVEICVSLGLVEALLPGVGMPIEKRSKLFSLVKTKKPCSTIENYDCLVFTTNVLTKLVNSNTIFKSVILSTHLGDYLCALFQLCYTPLLKAGCCSVDGTFTMTDELYTRLNNERQYFKHVLNQLQSSLNQTDLLKAVIIIFGCIQSGGKKHVWFTKACTKILNQALDKANGIEMLLKAMCENDYTSPLVWKKLNIVAKIIASMKSVYAVTCPQILDMLKYNNKLIESSEQHKLNHQFSIPTCKHLYQQDPIAFHQHIFSHLVSPLETIESAENPDLTSCLVVIDRVFSHVDGLPRELLVKYANRIFFLYVRLFKNPLFTEAKVPLENLLTTLLTSFRTADCEAMINLMIFQVNGAGLYKEKEKNLDEDDIDESVHDETESTNLLEGVLSFPPGTIRTSPAGSISYISPDTGKSVPDNYEEYGQCVLGLLEKCKKQNSLFICLLNNYTTEMFKDDFNRNLVNVSLLNNLVTKIKVDQFISDTPEHMIMLIQFLIKQSCRNNKDDPSADNTDALCTGLTLLSILMGEHSKYNAKQCAHIVPSLESLINESNNEEVVLLAKQCLEQIKVSNVTKSGGTKLAESYEKALCDACDPLLPVRAHGIATLTKLILSGDAHAKANMSALLCLFMENLSDPDSYIYLASVEGLAALAADHAATVVDSLTQQLISSSRELECRLKLGEVLMKVARHLGELLPAYKSHFLNAFLHGCKDDDHLMRASCLSNLAEVCRLLGYRVGSILSEIFICIKCIINSDPYPEPRRAAVMVTSYLLCGLEQDTLQVLEPILPEFYRTLRHLYEHDPDDRTRLHAQLALEQLNEAVKTFLTPSLPRGFATLRL